MSTVTNAMFIDSMLSDIQIYATTKHPLSINLVITDTLDLMKGHFTRKRFHTNIHPFIAIQIKKIETRVKDIYAICDAMYYVIGLYVRNKGGTWDDMDKYRQKSKYKTIAQKPNNRP